MTDYESWKLKADADVEHIDGLISSPRSKAPGELWTELDNLIQWLARSGELLSEIESLYESAAGAQAEELAKDKSLAPSTITTIAKGKCADIKETFRRIERQNAALVHAIDGVRSLLSYEKETMRLTPK
jgi:hypothetical protein